jgi:predicted RNA-binding Zn-ribbon protein involved in translation (DUF1610 family)
VAAGESVVVRVGSRIECPKCGRPGSLAVEKVRAGKYEYWYAVVRHYESKKVRKCYISRVEGPAEAVEIRPSEVKRAERREPEAARRALEAAGEPGARVCPRCGKPYRVEVRRVRGAWHFYANHGRRGRVPLLCYLGPVQPPRETLTDVRALLEALRLAAGGAPPGERLALAGELSKLAEEIYKLALDLAKP